MESAESTETSAFDELSLLAHEVIINAAEITVVAKAEILFAFFLGTFFIVSPPCICFYTLSL
jgi:hypothetical protein